jgi:hypothetical protein
VLCLYRLFMADELDSDWILGPFRIMRTLRSPNSSDRLILSESIYTWLPILRGMNSPTSIATVSSTNDEDGAAATRCAVAYDQ